MEYPYSFGKLHSLLLFIRFTNFFMLSLESVVFEIPDFYEAFSGII